VGVQPGSDRADENHGAHARGLGGLAQDSWTVHVHLEKRLRPVAPYRDQADHVLDSLCGLRDGSRVQRVTHHDLGAADLESGGLHRVADQHPQLVPGVDQLMGDAAPEEAGRTEQQDPRHGCEC
jgi:hypothetical protein